MNKISKSIFSFITSVVVGVSLTACGSTQAETKTTDNSTEVVKKEEPKEEKSITVKPGEAFDIYGFTFLVSKPRDFTVKNRTTKTTEFLVFDIKFTSNEKEQLFSQGYKFRAVSEDYTYYEGTNLANIYEVETESITIDDALKTKMLPKGKSAEAYVAFSKELLSDEKISAIEFSNPVFRDSKIVTIDIN